MSAANSSTARLSSQASGGSQNEASGVQSPSADAVQSNEGTAPTTEINGVLAKAQVVAGGKEYSFSPNSLGLFPRVGMGLEDTVSVAVAYPEGTAGDAVTIQSEDGGTLAGGKSVLQANLDADLQVRFPFKSTSEGGIYRVTLRKGFDEKRLEFWGGPEPLVQSTNN